MATSNTLTYTANAGSVVIAGMGSAGAPGEIVAGDAAKRSPLAAAVAQEFIKRSSETATISGASKKSPVVITATAHGYASDDVVLITAVVGMVELNRNRYSITRIDANDFSLQDQDGVADIDGTGFTTYTSAGSAAIDGIAGTVTISLP